MTSDPLGTIYREIIQPLIGDFFEVDAVLSSHECVSNHELDNRDEEQACSCCVAPWADRHYHTAASVERGGSTRSEGECDGGFS